MNVKIKQEKLEHIMMDYNKQKTNLGVFKLDLSKLNFDQHTENPKSECNL